MTAPSMFTQPQPRLGRGPPHPPSTSCSSASNLSLLGTGRLSRQSSCLAEQPQLCGGSSLIPQHIQAKCHRASRLTVSCSVTGSTAEDDQETATVSLLSSVNSKPLRTFDEEVGLAASNGASTSDRGPSTWPPKADLYIVRTDGMSCSRETVRASGCLSFAHPSTQQHLLVWKSPPKCVLVIKKLGDELRAEFVEALAYLGEEQRLKVIVEPHEHRRLAADGRLPPYIDTFTAAELAGLHSYIDFVVCLGGDGVLLHASALFRRAIPPVISFHLGSLGFLTNHDYRYFRSDLRDVIYGCEDLDECSLPEEEMKGVHVTLRMRLLCGVVRAGQAEPEQTHEVMNEVVVDRGANPFLTKIECWEHNRLITKVQADGVMLATPTGSTAYSVAAGGSMVHPNVPAILFTPICPHSLSFRPVILPDYAEIELRIPKDARCSAWVCFDGKNRQELHHGDSVRVRMSPNPVPTINKVDQTNDWFGSLERCFNWNDRAEQRGFGSTGGTGSMHPYTYDSDDGSSLISYDSDEF